MRSLALLLAVAVACTAGTNDAQVKAEVERTLRDAYDLSKPGVADRMLALYPETGRVVSATGGSLTTSRDTLERGIRYFWDAVGRNMRQPQWIWDQFLIDVLSPRTAVVTATYRIPHRDPRNAPHMIAGAMTVVMQKRDGRWEILQEHLSDLPTSATDSAAAHVH